MKQRTQIPQAAATGVQARQILDEMTAQTEVAMAALEALDDDGVNAALSKRDRLMERADAVLASLHGSPGSASSAPAEVLDAAMRLRSISERLQHSIEERRFDVARQLRSLDAEETQRGAYGRSGARSQHRIDVVR